MAIELQKGISFTLSLLLKITDQLLGIKNELMDEEYITLELEQLPWYVELEGKKNNEFKVCFESQDQTRFWNVLADTNCKNLFYEIKTCGNQWIKK